MTVVDLVASQVPSDPDPSVFIFQIIGSSQYPLYKPFHPHTHAHRAEVGLTLCNICVL